MPRSHTLSVPLSLAVAATSLTVLYASGASPAHAAASGGVITSSGPLTSITTSADLNCAVNHEGDVDGEFYGDTACGTFVAVDGTLYGPSGVPAGGNATPRTTWTQEGQTSSGAGTTVNPYRIVTVVSGGPLVLTQTDTYVTGEEAYATRVSIENTTDQPKSITLYRAGDCYLQNDDRGYGRAEPAAGSVACATGTDAASRIEQWAPLTPGSHYYESYYGSVWSQIGSQQPFPDTVDADTYQDNGAGLSWTQSIPAGSTSSFSHITAFSPTGTTEVSDSDGDGFPDSWESPDGGVDTNGDGIPDLKLSDYGATPDRPDVFVQVDTTETRSCAVLSWFCSTTNRHPSLAALADVQHAFAQHGVRLHIDAGSQSLMNPDTNAKWGALSQGGRTVSAPARLAGWSDQNGMDWSTFDSLVADNHLLSAARSRIFHHALYVGSFNAKGNSGLSRSSATGFASRDFILAYDVINGGHPTRMQEAGTFMHELGHNLGLSHGGSIVDATANWKPNYPSVMNYFWQFSGTYKSSTEGLLDYSEGTLADIDENSLSESAGLEPDSAAGDIATMWSCPNGSARGPLPSVYDVDWNCNGQIDSGTVATNVTNIRSNDSDLKVLSDHNDWDSLVYDGGGALGAAGDPQSVATTTEADSEPASADDIESASPTSTSVLVSTPGQLAMQAHTTSPVDIAITNQRDATITYDLTAIAHGVSLSGVPVSVQLAPNETKTIHASLTSGAARNDGFFEVDATASGDAANSGAGVSEVYVVNSGVAHQPGVAANLRAGGTVSTKLRLQQTTTMRVLSRNAGPSPAAGTTLVVRLPRFVTVTNLHRGKVKTAGQWRVITWKVGTLQAAHQFATLFRLKVGRTDARSFRITVRTTSSTADPNRKNNQVTRTVAITR